MRVHSFFATVHQDRFAELGAVIGDAPVTVETYSFGDDHTFEVYITGEVGISLRLSEVISSIKHILESAPVAEEV